MLIPTICPLCSKECSVKPYRMARVGETQPNPPYCSRKCSAVARGCTRFRTHGLSKSKEYHAWQLMRRRCTEITSNRYHIYGGRGIKVCNEWMESFEQFLSDVGRAPSERHSLGRIDNDGDYAPGNVEWQEPEVQANNTSRNRFITAFGKTQTLQQWARQYALKAATIGRRISNGWGIEEAISTPNLTDGSPGEHLVTFRGKTMNLASWSRETGIDDYNISVRIRKGWSIEKTLTTPVAKLARRKR